MIAGCFFVLAWASWMDGVVIKFDGSNVSVIL